MIRRTLGLALIGASLFSGLSGCSRTLTGPQLGRMARVCGSLGGIDYAVINSDTPTHRIVCRDGSTHSFDQNQP